jgi:hypothetical protein
MRTRESNWKVKQFKNLSHSRVTSLQWKISSSFNLQQSDAANFPRVRFHNNFQAAAKKIPSFHFRHGKDNWNNQIYLGPSFIITRWVWCLQGRRDLFVRASFFFTLSLSLEVEDERKREREGVKLNLQFLLWIFFCVLNEIKLCDTFFFVLVMRLRLFNTS